MTIFNLGEFGSQIGPHVKVWRTQMENTIESEGSAESSCHLRCDSASTRLHPGKEIRKQKVVGTRCSSVTTRTKAVENETERGWLVIKDAILRGGLTLNHWFQFCRFSRGTAPRDGFVKLRLIYAKRQTFRNIKRHDSYSTAFSVEQRQLKGVSLRMW